MLLDHQKFDYKGKRLIEKVVVKAPFRLSVNFEDEACFIHFFQGEARINSPYEHVPMQPEDSVLLRCGSHFADLMKYGNEERYEILVFHLNAHLLKAIYSEELPTVVKQTQQSSISSLTKQSFVKKVASEEVVKKFVDGLSFYFDHPELVNDDLLELKIKELILLLLQTKNAASIQDLFTQLFAPREVSIREVVHNHLFSDLSIEDLAQLAGMSLSTFKRSFQEHFSDSPASYIRIKRLEHARHLLQVSEKNISEIAYETKFTDVAHFSRLFKTLYGETPSRFRESLA